MLVYADPSELPEEFNGRIPNTNRLPGLADSYTPSDEVVNFSDANTIEELNEMLRELEEKNLHIVGSRGFVYHSGRIRMMVVGFMESGYIGVYNNFPRTGLLRDTYFRLTAQPRND